MPVDDSDRRPKARPTLPTSNGLTVYTAFYWTWRTQDVTFHFASLDAEQALVAACAHLATIDIAEPGYKEFLIGRIEQWDGKDVHITTTAEGSLVLMPTPLAVTGP